MKKPRHKEKKKPAFTARSLKATVVTSGLLVNMLGAVPATAAADHQPLYTGNSLEYLSSFLGVSSAYASDPQHDEEMMSLLSDPETGPETSPETDPESGSETGPETDPESGSETGPETDPESGSETGPETDPESGSETGPETDPESGSETDPETDPESGSETGPETDPETSTGLPVSVTDMAAMPGNGQATISFSAPTGASGVVLEISTDNIHFTPAQVAAPLHAASTGAIVSSLTNGQTYYFRLSLSAGEHTSYSNTISIVPVWSGSGWSPPAEQAKATDGQTLLPSSTEASGMSAPNSAQLAVATDDAGKRVARFTLMPEGIQHAYDQAVKKDIVFVDASSQVGLNALRVTSDASLFSQLSGKENYLSIRTGTLSMEVPAISIAGEEFVKRHQIQGAVEVELQLLEASARDQARVADWASRNNASVVGESYQTMVQLRGGGISENVAGFGNRFARFVIPVPADVQHPSRLAAVMLRDGVVVPVPMSLDAQGQAVIHTTENAVIMLIERSVPVDETKPHWSSPSLQALASKGLIASENTLAELVQGPVTRAQFASLIVDALGLGYREAGDSQFTDLTGDAVTDRMILAATDIGLFRGVTNDTFSPDTVISREQMISVVMRAVRIFDLNVSGGTIVNTSRSDHGFVSGWARDDVQAAFEWGLVRGYPGGTSGAVNAATTAEAVQLLHNLLTASGLSSN